MNETKPRKLSPEVGCRVLFAAASAFAEKIKIKPKRVQLTGRHTGQAADLDNGWIIIDRQWYAKD